MIQCICAFVLFLACGSARADDGWRSVKNMPDFSDVIAQLQVLVNVNGFHKINQICVAGFEVGTYDAAEIYWPVEHKFILWEPQSASEPLLMSRRYLDTRRDVVPTENDLHGSTYLWTAPELNEFIKECHKYGDNYTIKKSYTGWQPISKFQQFSTIRNQLQYLVDQQSSQQQNEFFVIAQKDQTFLGVYIYWPAQNRLILSVPDKMDGLEPWALTVADSDVDLKKGAVETVDMDPMIDEMPREFAKEIVKICLKSGEKILITKSHS